MCRMDAGVLGADSDPVASPALSGRSVVQGLQTGLTAVRRRVGSRNRTLEDDLSVVALSNIDAYSGLESLGNVGSEMIRRGKRWQRSRLWVLCPSTNENIRDSAGMHIPSLPI